MKLPGLIMETSTVHSTKSARPLSIVKFVFLCDNVKYIPLPPLYSHLEELKREGWRPVYIDERGTDATCGGICKPIYMQVTDEFALRSRNLATLPRCVTY